MSFISYLLLFVIIFLIVAIIFLTFYIKTVNTDKKEEDKKEPVYDDPEENGLNMYEDDQEKTAIISYSELMKSANAKKLVYENELNDEDIDVKKVNVTDNETKKEIDIKSEEKFLSMLESFNKK